MTVGGRMPKRQEALGRGSIDSLQKLLWGLLLVSFPFTDVSIWPKVMKMFGQPTIVIAMLLGILVLAEGIARPRSIFIPKGRSVGLFGLVLAILGLSFFVNHPINPYMWPGHSPWVMSAKQIIQWTADGAIVYFTLRFVRTWKDLRYALSCYFFGFLACVASAGLEMWAARNPIGIAATIFKALHNLGFQESGRLDLLAQEPSWAADYVLCVLPLLICGSYYWKRRAWKLFWSAVALLLFFGTFSLGGFASLVAAAVIVPMAYVRKGSRGSVVALLLLVGILTLAMVNSSKGKRFVGDRISDIFENGLGPSIPDFSAQQRLAAAQAAFGIFLEHPWTGVGIGKSPFYLFRAYPRWGLEERNITAATFWNSYSPESAATFNLYVQMLAETGILGGVVLVSLLVSMLADCYKAMSRAKETWKRRAFAGILMVLVGLAIHYNAESLTGLRYWFFIWGLAMCAPHLQMQDDPELTKRMSVSLALAPFQPRGNFREVKT